MDSGSGVGRGSTQRGEGHARPGPASGSDAAGPTAGASNIGSMPARRDTYTPESLLTVAVQVFIERGYDGTSMEHLSRAAGISKSSIYHHVRGKEELLRRAISRALDGLFGILQEPQAPRGPRRRPPRTRRPPHHRGPDGRAALRHAAAARAGQHRHRALGDGPPPRVRPAGRRAAEAGRGRRRPALRRGRPAGHPAALRNDQLGGRVVPARPRRRRRSGRAEVAEAVVRTAFAGLRTTTGS